MKKNEAISILATSVRPREPKNRTRYDEAVKMAIEALRQPDQRWIPCEQRMPEEHEWIGTKRFGTTISDEVYVTFERPDGGRFTKHMCFQNGKLSNHDQLTIDAFHKGAIPIAWKPLPDPWEGDTRK